MSKIRIGVVNVSDRASAGVYEDLSGPEIERHVAALFPDCALDWQRVLLPDDIGLLSGALVELVDDRRCALIVTTGGTGPAPRDVMPEATRAVIERELPGFGEIMRAYSFEQVKVSILSRASAGVRGRTFIINMPSRPKAVKFCLRIVRDGLVEVLDQVAGILVTLRRDEIVVPLEKWFPFLKRFRVQPNPDGEHPYIGG